jgi:protocatechuate 3,4-dioxygenase beta subunit
MLLPAVLLSLLAHAVPPLQDATVLPGNGPQVVLRGIVRAVSGEPLRGARVVLTDAGESPAGAVLTDQSGRFEAPVVEGQTYTLLVKKAGYAPERVRVSAGPDGESLEIRLVKGAALTGRVINEVGDPVADVRVRARPRPESSASEALLPVVASSVTDDLGEYRIGSLPAGRYEMTLAGGDRLLRLDAERGAITIISPSRSVPDDGAGREPAAVVQLDAGEEERLDIVRPRDDANRTASASAIVLPASPRRIGSPGESMATISGHVLGPGLRAVEQANVRLVSASGWPPNQLADRGQDGDGYEFGFVPPGTYRIVASGPGMIDGEYGTAGGTARGTGSGSWIQVRDGDRLEDFDVVLQRAAVIAGMVMDGYGEPLEGMSVQAWRAVSRNGRIELSAAALSRVTDDRGHYRVHGLQPGTYYVAVSESLEATPVSGFTPAIAVLSFAPFSPALAPAEPTTFYPGRASIREAVPVYVDAGVDATGVNVEFAPQPGVRVTGVALNAAGEPFAGSVTLGVSRRSGAPLRPPWQAATGADGAFEFPDVPPGDYVVQVDGRLARLHLVRGGNVIGLETSRVSQTGFGTQPVTVGDADVGPLTIRTMPGSTVAGRIVQEGPGPPAANAAFTLNAVTADTDLGPAMPAGIRPDGFGTFEVSGLVGPMRFLPANVPTGWWLKSVMIDGVNAADMPVTFGSQQESKRNVEIVFSSVPTGISGRVRERGQDALTGAAVIAFSVDPSHWYAGSRHLKRSTSIDGRFNVPSLPPGDYYVVAADSIDAAQWQEPDVLQRLMPLATFVTVREGPPVSMDLDVVRVP